MARLAWWGMAVLLACGGGGEGVGGPTSQSTEPLPPPCPLPTPVQRQAASAQAALSGEEGRQGVLVRFRPGHFAPAAVEGSGGRVGLLLPQAGVVAAQLTPRQQALLSARPEVASVEPDRRVRAFGPPRSALSLADVRGEVTPGLRQVQADAVWDRNGDGLLDARAPTGEGITVCVLDSGIDLRHPELQAAYVGGYDFVDRDEDPSDGAPLGAREPGREGGGSGHGTHVAATLAARPGAGGVGAPGMDPGGIIGVAPGVRLLVGRVLDEKGEGDTSTLIEALHWCQQQGARIASLSLGAEERSEAEEAAVQQVVAAGLLVVAASGNGGRDALAYPAGYPGVVAVGAVDAGGGVSAFSQRGEALSFVAPGEGVLSATLVGSGVASHLEVGGRPLPGDAVEHAPVGTYRGRLVDCGLGDSYASCARGASCAGFVALVQRGGLEFGRKAQFVQGQGARAIIIVDSAEDASVLTLGQEGAWAPTVAVGRQQGGVLRRALGQEVEVGLVPVDYVRASGTSMAVPHVAGVAALVWSARPGLTAAEVVDVLARSALDVGPPGRDAASGWGLVQARAALDLLEGRR